ncbi:MAG TPA: histidine phosphatase family protein [Acidimicrobiales bacterium]|nr:histidine phosphatase family protein [Acidimicrobiales bacterium]
MLVLVRHGESEANAAGLLVGRMESPLTERGLVQAHRIGEVVGPVQRVTTSPLGRARQTAAAIGPDARVEVDDRWVEVDYGEFDGTRLGAVPAEVWTRWRADPAYRPPGGESLDELGRRVRPVCEELFAEDGAGARGADDVVVVSHVSPIKAAVAWALGVGDEVAWRLYLAPGSITRIGWGAGVPVLHRYNEVPLPTDVSPLTDARAGDEAPRLDPASGAGSSA